jgi:hypothetical protein
MVLPPLGETLESGCETEKMIHRVGSDSRTALLFSICPGELFGQSLTRL